MREQLKAVMKAKTIGEALKLLPWSFVEAFAIIPILMFIFSVVVETFMYTSIYYPYVMLMEDMWISFYILGVVSIFLYVGKCVVEKLKFRDIIKQNMPMIFFTGMSIFMLISTMINGWTEYALIGHEMRKESVFVYLTYFFVFFLGASLVKNEKIKKNIIYLFVAISLIFGICVVFTLLFDTHTFTLEVKYFKFWIMAIYNNPNHYAYYLNVVIICSAALFVLEKNKILKWLCFLNFVLNIVILILNNTFGCYLACIGGLIFLLVVLYMIDKRIDKNTIFLLGIFIVISIIMSFFVPTVFSNLAELLFDIKSIVYDEEDASSAGTGRWRLWMQTVEYISERPIFGFGTEGIADAMADLGYEERTHNEYLQYTAFYGIPAALCYLAGIMAVFIHGLKNKAKLDKYAIISLAAAFAYCFSAFFGVSRTYTAPYLFIFLGLGFGICRNREK